MQWDKALEQEVFNNFSIPSTWLDIYYYEALNILFRIENSLRIFVYIVLKNELKDKWTDISIESDDQDKSTIGAIAKKRLTQHKYFEYLGYTINSPIMHLTSGELIRLIMNDSYWKYFSCYFPAKKNIIEYKLDEIIDVRNSLAHFRPIKEDDIELIKQNAKHVLINIERCISNLLRCFTPVPTNTIDEWYKVLKPLGTEDCIFNLFQSPDTNWLKLNLQYNSHVIKESNIWEGFKSFTVLNIKSNSILKEFGDLSKNVIYLLESGPFIYTTSKPVYDFRKTISIGISKKTVTENYEIIKNELQKLLLLISEETEMITQDSLAKGKIIDSVYTNSNFDKDKKFWKTDTSVFEVSNDATDPPEYWGQLGIIYPNYISDTNKYPWMQRKISQYSMRI